MKTLEQIAQETTEKVYQSTSKQQVVDAILTALQQRDQEHEAQVDTEQSRWQDRIDTILLAECPDAHIDGSGVDSGDPLDLTACEIRQAFGWLKDQHAAQVVSLTKERDDALSRQVDKDRLANTRAMDMAQERDDAREDVKRLRIAITKHRQEMQSQGWQPEAYRHLTTAITQAMTGGAE